MELSAVMGTSIKYFFACLTALSTAMVTSAPLAAPTPTLPFLLPTITTARKLKRLPPAIIRAVLLTSKSLCSKSCFSLTIGSFSLIVFFFFTIGMVIIKISIPLFLRRLPMLLFDRDIYTLLCRKLLFQFLFQSLFWPITGQPHRLFLIFVPQGGIPLRGNFLFLYHWQQPGFFLYRHRLIVRKYAGWNEKRIILALS